MRPPPEIIEIPIRIKTTSTQFNQIASSVYGPRVEINTTFTQTRDQDITELILSEEPAGTNLDSAVFGDFYEIARLKFNRSDIQARIDNPSLFNNDAPLLYLDIRFQLNGSLRINYDDPGNVGAGYNISMNGGSYFNYADFLQSIGNRLDGSSSLFGGPRQFAISIAGSRNANFLEFDAPGIDIEIFRRGF